MRWGCSCTSAALSIGAGDDPLHHPPPALRGADADRDQLHPLRPPRPRAQRPHRPAAAHHPGGSARADPRVARARGGLPHPLRQVDGAVLRQRAAQPHRTHLRRGDRRFRGAPAGALLGDAQPGRGPHHRAPAADALGGRPLLHYRHPHRDPDRHRLGLPAVFLVRPAGHLRLHDRLLGADLLHRPARDHGLQRHPAVAAVDLRHHAPGHRSRKLLGADQADGDAGDGARALQRGADQPLHAGRRAGQPDAGLRAHRPRQGPARAGRALHPRAAQQPDPGGDADRARHPHRIRRRHHHGEDLSGERHRRASHHGDPGR